MMDKDRLSKLELDSLEIFFDKKSCKELSPRDLDQEMKIGVVKSIDIFLELELNQCIEWISLDLMELELGQSTEKIYQQIYNSQARLTDQGKQFAKTKY